MSFVQLGNVPAIESFRAEMKEVTERSDGEKMILLMLRRGNDLAKACIRIGESMGWKPVKKDWRSLIACKLIQKDAKTGFLVLTSTGLMWANRLANAMGRIGGLHFLLPAGGDRYHVTVMCSCGFHDPLSINQGHLITGQINSFSRHLRQVEAGLWKRPRPLEEIVGDVFASVVPPDRPIGNRVVVPEVLEEVST